MQRTVIIKRSHSTNSIMEEFGNGRWNSRKSTQHEGLTVQAWLMDGVLVWVIFVATVILKGSLRLVPRDAPSSPDFQHY